MPDASTPSLPPAPLRNGMMAFGEYFYEIKKAPLDERHIPVPNRVPKTLKTLPNGAKISIRRPAQHRRQ